MWNSSSNFHLHGNLPTFLILYLHGNVPKYSNLHPQGNCLVLLRSSILTKICLDLQMCSFLYNEISQKCLGMYMSPYMENTAYLIVLLAPLIKFTTKGNLADCLDYHLDVNLTFLWFVQSMRKCVRTQQISCYEFCPNEQHCTSIHISLLQISNHKGCFRKWGDFQLHWNLLK